MTTYSIEYCVVWAFNRTNCTTEPNRIIPLQQGHLLLDINEWREVFGQPEISMEQLARCLTRMKSEGKIRRISWSTAL